MSDDTPVPIEMDPIADVKARGITFTVDQRDWLNHHLRNPLTIIRYGTPEQKARGIRRLVDLANAIAMATE